MTNLMIKADLHNHLGRNGANPGFDKSIDLVYKKLGNNFMFGICNSTPTDYRFENFTNQKGKYERVWLDDEKRILEIPEKQIYIVGAEEVVTKQGHLVVAGMPSNKKIQKNDKTMSLEDALKSADDFNGIKIVVHPFGRDGSGNYLLKDWDNQQCISHLNYKGLSFDYDGDYTSKQNSLLDNIDGWEVYNASAALVIPGILPFDANGNSIFEYDHLISHNFYIGACAFTDGHSVEVIGRSYTDLNLENISMDSLKQAIRSSRDSENIHISENFKNLHMEPAKWDAFKHAVNM